MSRTIRIDDEVYQELKGMAEPFEDTPNDVLRRLLELNDAAPIRKNALAANGSSNGNGMIEDPVMLIRINKSYRPGMSGDELYQATRYAWRVGERRDQAEFAMAVHDGVVLEIYEIYRWCKAAPKASDWWIDERWEFDGAPAAESVRSQYVGMRVDSYLPHGSQNPIRYINC